MLYFLQEWLQDLTSFAYKHILVQVCVLLTQSFINTVAWLECIQWLHVELTLTAINNLSWVVYLKHNYLLLINVKVLCYKLRYCQLAIVIKRKLIDRLMEPFIRMLDGKNKTESCIYEIIIITTALILYNF